MGVGRRFCGSFAHYCMARALVHADATVVMPMDFLRVPLTALIGYLLYSESLDLVTALGAALILVGNLLNLQRGKASPPAVAKRLIAITDKPPSPLSQPKNLDPACRIEA